MNRVLAAYALAMASLRKRSVYHGFMPLRGFDREWPEVQCLSSEHAPDVGTYRIDPNRDGVMVIFGSPNAWATQGARNMADVYRPAGVP